MLTNTNVRHTYQGNGSNTNFTIPFDIMDSDVNEVLVYVRDETVAAAPVTTLKTYGALQDYTLSGAIPPTTPFNTTVVFNTAPTINQKVILIRLIPYTQLLNLLTSGQFDFANMNHAYDRIVAMIQLLNDMLLRAPVLGPETQITSMALPEPIAGGFIGFDSTGKFLSIYSLATISGSLVATPTTLTELGYVHGVTSPIQAQLNLLFTAPIETQFTLANNQSAASSVTGLLLANATNRAVVVDYTIERRSSNQGYRQIGSLVCMYDAFLSTWSIEDNVKGGASGLTTGVTFSITSTGQIQYVTDNMTGSSYVGKLRYKTFTKFLTET